jgi:chromosome partitioning protein
MSKHSLNSMATMRDNAPLFHTRLHQRTAYVEAMLTGDSVHYFGSSAKAAVKEIEALFDEVMLTLYLQVPKVRTRK